MNSLIDHTEYKEGALTKPTETANEVFRIAETLFRYHRHRLIGQQKMGERMTKIILENLPTKFGNIPSCHLKVIFKRFVKIRFHFWTNFENSVAQQDEKYLIIGESNSSRSMKAHYL